MLKLKIEESEFFNEDTLEFYYIKPCTLRLEHSLLSVSKWEARWKKAFINPRESDKTTEEVMDYVRCMTTNKEVDPLVYRSLTNTDYDKIRKYIEDPMTATEIRSFNPHRSSKIITSEEIYHWMISFNVPFECEKWHLNRLFALLEICAIKSQGGKKMSQQEVMRQNMELNERRIKAMGIEG